MPFDQLRRRDFITLLGGAAAWPLAARAQAKRARIGWFTVAPHPYIDGFRRGLRELGWIEGENVLSVPRSSRRLLDQLCEARARGVPMVQERPRRPAQRCRHARSKDAKL